MFPSNPCGICSRASIKMRVRMDQLDQGAQLTPSPCIICSYKNRPSNSFRICSYKTLNLKSFGICSYKKTGVYTPSIPTASHSLTPRSTLSFRVCHNAFMAPEIRNIQRHVLPNGLVVITEPMSHVRSVSVGVWIRNGSRREIPQENGLAHFMEHMVFKGTERRSAEAIAREMDSIGGMLDAFTSKEQICFNAKVLDQNLPIAFDIISDLCLHPRFDSTDIKNEQQVVLEEIKMDMDNP